VNGVTRNWPAFYLTDASGNLLNWSVANIGVGTSIAFRFDGLMK
jgi:hypothetical protein